jgi:Tfp pilus assembly protein PilV
MSAQQEKGFTIVEVMLAMIFLTVGVMAMVGSSAMATRMIGKGRQSTLVGQVAAARAEWLRQVARSTATPCTSLAFKSDSAVTGTPPVTEKWVLEPVAAGASGNSRTFTMSFRYRIPRGVRADTFTTSVLCK